MATAHTHTWCVQGRWYFIGCNITFQMLAQTQYITKPDSLDLNYLYWMQFNVTEMWLLIKIPYNMILFVFLCHAKWCGQNYVVSNQNTMRSPLGKGSQVNHDCSLVENFQFREQTIIHSVKFCVSKTELSGAVQKLAYYVYSTQHFFRLSN